MSSPAVSASPATERRGPPSEGGAAGAPLPDRRLRGYGEIAAASLILGTSATLIQVSTMPASLLVVLRMALAGVVLGALFLATGGVAEVRRCGHLGRMIVLGCVVALELLFYFAAIRLADVTVGVSLEYTAPIFVAVAAPWVLHTRRQAIDMVAVAIAAAGMTLILVPTLSLATGAGSVWGVVCGLLAGVCFATAMILVKSLGPDVRGSTLALFFCLGSVVLITPLAVWQTWTSHYQLTATDAWIVVVSGLVYTALCFSLYTDGIRYVRVEHAGVLGYLEPVTSPLWALILIGEKPAWTTLAGGALIIVAGILVVTLGAREGEPLLEPQV
jgi:drug/metabolite transporter (DMT)-like permease